MPKELIELDIDEISLVDKAANKKRFFLMKAEDGKPDDKKALQKSFHGAVLGALDRVMKTMSNIFTVIATDQEMMGDKFRAEIFPTEKAVKDALKALGISDLDVKQVKTKTKEGEKDDKDGVEEGDKLTPEQEKEIQAMIDEQQKLIDGLNAEDGDSVDMDSVNENLQASNDLAEELESST